MCIGWGGRETGWPFLELIFPFLVSQQSRIAQRNIWGAKVWSYLCGHWRGCQVRQNAVSGKLNYEGDCKNHEWVHRFNCRLFQLQFALGMVRIPQISYLALLPFDTTVIIYVHPTLYNCMIRWNCWRSPGVSCNQCSRISTNDDKMNEVKRSLIDFSLKA